MSPNLVNILARIYAVNAEVEAMKAANYEREANQQALAYTDKDFHHAQWQLENLASEAVQCSS